MPSAERSAEYRRPVRPGDVGDLHQFGYAQSLRRTMGPYASFAVAFSMVSITTAIFFLLPSLFGTRGAAGVWLWIPCAAGVFLIVLVYSHLAARIPITGFAYQWNSRLINPHYGWFTGYTALLAFMAGTAATAVALATGVRRRHLEGTHSRRHRAARHRRHGRRRADQHRQHPAVSAVNNVGVFFEIVGSVGRRGPAVLRRRLLLPPRRRLHILASTQRTSGGAALVRLRARRAAAHVLLHRLGRRR